MQKMCAMGEQPIKAGEIKKQGHIAKMGKEYIRAEGEPGQFVRRQIR